MYIKYKQGLCHSRLSTADYALFLVASTTTAVYSWTVAKVKSKSYCDWWPVSKSWCRVPSGAHDQIFITVWQLQSCFCGAPSLMRGCVCFLYMLLVLASAVFLGLATILYNVTVLDHFWTLNVACYATEGTSCTVFGYLRRRSDC
jgi:hypothetical protein